MSKLTLIVLIISIGITLFFFVIITSILLILRKKMQISKVTKISEEINEEFNQFFIASDNELTRIEKTIKNNPQNKLKFDKVMNQYLKLRKNIELLNEDILLLKNSNQKSNKYQIQIFFEKLNKLKLEKNNIEKKINEIKLQDKFLENEFQKYLTIFRKTFEVYKKKKTLLSLISNQILELLNEIKKLRSSFLDENNFSLPARKSKILNELRTKIEHFVLIVDEGPSIQIYISKSIKEEIKKINRFYLEQRDHLSNLSNFDEKKLIEKIKINFEITKNSFMELDIEKAKFKITEIFKDLKYLSNTMKHEVKLQKFIATNKGKVNLFWERSNKKYLELEDRMTKLAAEGKQLPIELMNIFNETTIKYELLNKTILLLRKELVDANIRNMTKIQNFKKVIRMNISFIDSLNLLASQIWFVNIEETVALNKVKKIESSLMMLITLVKTHKIKLMLTELNHYKYLENKVGILNQKIRKKEIDKELNNEIDKVNKLIIKFYRAIYGKIEMVTIIKNLFKEFAHYRALNEILDHAFKKAEEEFLEMKYEESLSRIISNLEVMIK